MSNKNKDFKIIFTPIEVSSSEHQKRVDEFSDILYELYCQHQLKQSVQQKLNANTLPKDMSPTEVSP